MFFLEGPFVGWPELVWGAMALVMNLFVLGLVVWLIITLLKRSSGSGRSRALRVLEERYARGEIDREEFFERREVLSRTEDPGR